MQRIKNEFTVTVYEIHARMALEVVCPLRFAARGVCVRVCAEAGRVRLQGDMVEYNQCQAMLRSLYELGIPGKVEEFTAYRILMLLHGRNRSGESPPPKRALLVSRARPADAPSRLSPPPRRTDMNLYVGQLTERQKSDPAVRHALSVQRAVAMGNYHALFDLYLNAPNMGAYIMDHFIDRERIRALMVMTKA